MEIMDYLYGGESSYLGLFALLVTAGIVFLGAQSTAIWFWDKFGERISGLFRQSRL